VFRRQVVIASIVLVLSATAFALTKSNPAPATVREELALAAFPQTALRSSESTPSLIRSSAWLARQDPRFYTIQIFADTDDYAIPAFARQWKPAHPFARYQIKRHGEIWHFLTYGIFPTAAAARKALADLPQRVRLFSPRVQPLNQVLARLHGIAGTLVDPVASVGGADESAAAEYAISLYSAETVNELRQFAIENQIDDAYYARAKGSANSWVTLLKGHYASLQAARSDLGGLPESVREFAWVKKMGSPKLEVLSLDRGSGRVRLTGSANDSIKKDRQWLAAQKRDDLVVLVGIGKDRKRLSEAGSDPESGGNLHLVTYTENDAKRYAAVIGSFPDYGTAQETLSRIKSRSSESPVIITVGVLKDAYNGDAGSIGLLRGHDPGNTRVADSTDPAR